MHIADEDVRVIDEGRALLAIVATADILSRARLDMARTHESLRQMSAPPSEPSKPRAESKRAA
jgi:hypothetical protein